MLACDAVLIGGMRVPHVDAQLTLLDDEALFQQAADLVQHVRPEWDKQLLEFKVVDQS